MAISQIEKLEYALRKAKIEWRRVVDSPKSTPAEKNLALAVWRKASTDLELALAILRRQAAERRGAIPDRRKPGSDIEWKKIYIGDRRKKKRRS
jgi:hypothetical protein